MAATQLSPEVISSLLVGLLVVVCIVCVLLLLVLLRNRHKTHALQKQLLRLERNFRVINSSTISMGQQLIAFEKQLKSPPSASLNTPLINNVTPIPNHHSFQESNAELSDITPSEKIITDNEDTQDNTIYDQARRSLSQGMSIKDVAKQCGLSYGEVSLLKALGNQTDILSH